MRFSQAVYLLGPMVCFILVEILNGNHPFRDIELWRVLWNIGWYYAIFVLFWLITGLRRGAGGLCALWLSFGFGLVNHYVLRFRGTTLFPIDILSWRTAANVAAGYDYTPDTAVWTALAIAIVWSAVIVLAGMRRSPQRRAVPIAASVMLAGFLFAFFGTNMLPAFGIYAEQWLTQKNGFTFNFMCSLRYSFASEPEGYDLEALEEFKEEYTEDFLAEASEEPAVEPVNIILIMNESWADLSIYENYSASHDTMAALEALEGDSFSGYICTPVTGGGTANVEYEVLTGSPYCFVPEGTVPYQLFIDSESPSLASAMEAEGYESYAFHPYLASGWNRTQAYDYLGFENQIFEDDMTEPEYVRDYISDESAYEVITDITDAEKGKAFVFTVTMQNHSGYALEWTNLPRTVELQGGLDAVSSTAEQYLNLALESGEAFEELTEHYARSSEPTIIAMFGDHQPPLEDSFYDAILGEDNASLEGEARLIEYTVPFVVWANYDMDAPEDTEYFSGNYFGALFAELALGAQTPYLSFVTEVAEALPVIHRVGYIDDQGNFYDSVEDLSAREQQLLELYEALAYNYLFDRKEGDEFFEGVE